MESLALANQIMDVILDKQGDNILLLDIQELTPFSDYFIICSGQSNRQLDALQSAIREAMKQGDEKVLPANVEGTPESGWILLDYGGVIVHLFSPETRDYYQLEELWKEARVLTHIQ